MKRLGNRGDVRHAGDVYSRPVTFVETPNPRFELFGPARSATVIAVTFCFGKLYLRKTEF